MIFNSRHKVSYVEVLFLSRPLKYELMGSSSRLRPEELYTQPY